MNKTITIMTAALIALAGYAAPALSADVGVSIRVGQPGFFGRIDIGDAPRPRIIYAQPRIVNRVVIDDEPIYLHVRPGQARNWRKHCHRYDACGRPVYFVNDNWYNTVYVQHYRERGRRNDGHGHDGHDGNRRDDNRRDDRNRHDDNRRDDRNHHDDNRRDDHNGHDDNHRGHDDHDEGNRDGNNRRHGKDKKDKD